MGITRVLAKEAESAGRGGGGGEKREGCYIWGHRVGEVSLGGR